MREDLIKKFTEYLEENNNSLSIIQDTKKRLCAVGRLLSWDGSKPIENIETLRDKWCAHYSPAHFPRYKICEYYRWMRWEVPISFGCKYPQKTTKKQPETERKPALVVVDEKPNCRNDYDEIVIKHEKRAGQLFISSAQSHAPVHDGLMETLKRQRQDIGQEIVILPGLAHLKALETQDNAYSPELVAEADIFASRYDINQNLVAVDLKILPQQIEPLTGLKLMEPKSMIVGSPRQHLVTKPVSISKMPHIMMSTGSITNPQYQANRVGILADRAHTLGGVIVDVRDDLFFARHVQANEFGEYCDMGKRYSPSGVTEERPVAFVMGDLHAASVDMAAFAACLKIIEETQPSMVVIHDLFDANAINPHHVGRAFEQANRKFHLLDDEIRVAAELLRQIVDVLPDDAVVGVCRSNHDEMLIRHLESFRWREDGLNMPLCAQLFADQINGRYALEAQISRLIDTSRIEFWTRDSDIRVGGFIVSQHGDRGVQGARGNLRQLSQVAPCVIGHSHLPGMVNGSIQVGCTCELKQGYNSGVASWLHASALVYQDGSHQLIIIVDGQY